MLFHQVANGIDELDDELGPLITRRGPVSYTHLDVNKRQRLAQYEVTLLDWIEENKGACDYVVMANKCWPAFQTQFGFVPCYVNSRFTARGIPIACERCV